MERKKVSFFKIKNGKRIKVSFYVKKPGKYYLGKTPPKEELNDLYINKKLNSVQIAKRYDVSFPTILRWLREYNIQIRNKYEAQKGQSRKGGFQKGHKVPQEWREINRRVQTGKKHTEETKQKHREWILKNPINPLLGEHLSEKHKKNISKAHKKKFEDPAFCKEFGGRFHTTPNIPETIMLELIKQNNLPFNYTGDGAIWFKGDNYSFNPDFLSKNPKFILEIFGEYWHNLPKIKKRDEERIKTYKKFGYSTLIIWSDELKSPSNVVSKINSFINS